MCGRFTMHHTIEEIEERFAAEAVPHLAPDFDPRYNIAPTQGILVIRENGSRSLEPFKWGLVPSWAKDPAIGNRMINARAETLPEKPAFRTALTRRRCLIPADGFYEWQDSSEGRKGTRTPMHIRRQDGALFAFAGLWDEWHAPDGSPLQTCTIITVAANEVVAPIHERMPAILAPEAEAQWLDKTVQDSAALTSLLRPYPAEAMTAYPVSRQVNTPTVDDPECIAPVS